MHALQGVPAGVYVGGFRVVDVLRAAYTGDLLQSVRHTDKITQRDTYYIVWNARYFGSKCGGKGIVEIVHTCERQSGLLHFKPAVRRVYNKVIVFRIAFYIRLVYCRKGVKSGLGMPDSYLAGDDGVVIPEDESIGVGLVLEDAEFGVRIVLHLVIISVQMVGGDIQQDGDVGFEVVHIVQLKAAQLNHINCVRVFRHLQGKAVAYVSGKTNVRTRLLQYMIDEHGGGCFAVASGDANHLRAGISSGKFNLGYNRNAFFFQPLDNGSLVGDTGTFNYFISIQYSRFRMLPLFPKDTPCIQHILVLGRNGREVGKEHIKALRLCEDSGTRTAFASSQYNDAFIHCMLFGVPYIPTPNRVLTPVRGKYQANPLFISTTLLSRQVPCPCSGCSRYLAKQSDRLFHPILSHGLSQSTDGLFQRNSWRLPELPDTFYCR
ncbi:hypothetical protein Barb7_01987 [Bacteroidales bacterium Barb7]|nr:hypothetical protein Barb7_01987 [Bacteroidales bacterium Barb7]